MPVVSLVSPKGGVGKTTTALLIASTLHHRGQNVVLLDGDPNQPLSDWSDEGRNALPIIGGVRSETIVSVIDREAPQRDLVIVDTEGSAQRLTSRAIARSDLVIVPMGASTLDAAQAARAVSLIQQEEEAPAAAHHLPDRLHPHWQGRQQGRARPDARACAKRRCDARDDRLAARRV